MTSEESLADRLNRLAQQKRRDQEAEKQVQVTQEQINQFIYREARPEFGRLLEILEEKIPPVNEALKDLPKFELRKSGPYIKQGNAAAYLSFMQPIMNAGPILLRLSFGREPEGMYADFYSRPPEPERYELLPGMERNPDRIVWTGDLGEIASNDLAAFVLTHLTEYYLEHKPS
jgi:hypothetical protein